MPTVLVCTMPRSATRRMDQLLTFSAGSITRTLGGRVGKCLAISEANG